MVTHNASLCASAAASSAFNVGSTHTPHAPVRCKPVAQRPLSLHMHMLVPDPLDDALHHHSPARPLLLLEGMCSTVCVKL